MARHIFPQPPQPRVSDLHTYREADEPNAFFSESKALLATVLFTLLAAAPTLFSGCEDKNPFGLATCGDGVCHSSDPYVCPQDCGGIQITTGGEHTCTVKMSDGTVWCWGLNSYGQLGDGTLESASTPHSVTFGESVDAVFAGDNHTCALLTQERKVRCWGKNDSGQLGNGTTTDSATPVDVVGLDDVLLLSVGGAHTCALRDDGSVWCWGWNAYGQLGYDMGTVSETPQQVHGVDDVVRLSAGRVHTCALLRAGNVVCWGWNEFGQLGRDPSTPWSSEPHPVRGAARIQSLSSGSHHTCAVRDDGKVLCWGENDYGQLGHNLGAQSSQPISVEGLSRMRTVSSGRTHTCALKKDGSVWCWGGNASGQTGSGDDDFETTYEPVEVSRITGVSYVASGGYHTCAVEETGSLWCWGFNRVGQLGDNSVENRFTPVRVVGLGL